MCSSLFRAVTFQPAYFSPDANLKHLRGPDHAGSTASSTLPVLPAAFLERFLLLPLAVLLQPADRRHGVSPRSGLQLLGCGGGPEGGPDLPHRGAHLIDPQRLSYDKTPLLCCGRRLPYDKTPLFCCGSTSTYDMRKCGEGIEAGLVSFMFQAMQAASASASALQKWNRQQGTKQKQKWAQASYCRLPAHRGGGQQGSLIYNISLELSLEPLRSRSAHVPVRVLRSRMLSDPGCHLCSLT